MKNLVLFLAKQIFYPYGLLWTLSAPKASNVNEILELFYFKFLRIRMRDIEVVKLTNTELITRCRNPCPILKFTLLLGLDTRFTCKYVSEPVCNYVLKKLNDRIVFERNYNHIRPYKDSCEERIFVR
ncbi:MAG: hypothetical protein QW701_01385 [Candidatus Nezhaarchaeales archaeon]